MIFSVFLRLYLVGRTILFHSHLVRDASLQSLGYLNHVSINFFFLMKTFLEQYPIRSLSIFQTLAFFIGSWCTRACNYTSDGNHFSIGDSMWFYIVTFSTIGKHRFDGIEGFESAPLSRLWRFVSILDLWTRSVIERKLTANGPTDCIF